MSTYKKLEEVLKVINREHISLKTEEVKFTNELLKFTLDNMIKIMKSLDPMFNEIYQTLFYGGSYYDDLKVGRPDEFDLDFLFVLPKRCEIHRVQNCGCVNVIPSDKPGFFWFKVEEGFYEPFNKFIKDGYMQTNLVLSWLQGLITCALNELKEVDFEFGPPKHHSQSGPAFILRLYGKFGIVYLDLVPAFKFSGEYWPKEPFRQNKSVTKLDFFIVPKKALEVFYGERYWRPSFQDQERELIEGKERLKPSLRLLKKMRTNLGHSSIFSYALKTIVLWDVDVGTFNWHGTLSDTFMKLLENYRQSLSNGAIPYYWNNRDNLLNGIHPNTLENHHNEILKKIQLIEMHYKEDPLVVARVILKEGSDDYNSFKVKWDNQNCSFANIFQNNYNELEDDHSDQLTTEPVSSGLGTTGKFLLLGAALGIGYTVFDSIRKNRRNQD